MSILTRESRSPGSTGMSDGSPVAGSIQEVTEKTAFVVSPVIADWRKTVSESGEPSPSNGPLSHSSTKPLPAGAKGISNSKTALVPASTYITGAASPSDDARRQCRMATQIAAAAANVDIPDFVLFIVASFDNRFLLRTLAVTRRSIEKNSYKFPTKFLQFCRKRGISGQNVRNCREK